MTEATLLGERIATLEERTKPKSPSLLDRAKEWGGIVSLAIALGYTFPLGLWDRFMVTPQEHEARQVAAARIVVVQSAQLMADFGRSVSGIQDPRLRTMVSRAFNTQLHVLMASNATLISQQASRLAPQELLVLAYDNQLVGSVDRAIELYDQALGNAKDHYLRAEIFRLKAQALFIPSPKQDKNAARWSFQKAISDADASNRLQGIGSKISALSDWGSAEMLAGDWACGQSRLSEAMGLLQLYGPQMGDDGSTMQMLLGQLALTQRADQPAMGCPAISAKLS